MTTPAHEPVREHASRAAGPRRGVDAGPAAHESHAVVAPASRCGDVLDHLRRGRLAAAWAGATADRPVPVPGRADLERRFGASLAHVAVHTGPAARSLLDHLRADGAAAGSTIVLRSGSAPTATVAHEVAHTLQASGDAAPTRIVDADEDAEHEASRLERAANGPRRHQRLAPGWLALRRPRQRHVDVATADPARGTEDLDEVHLTVPSVPVPEPAAPAVPQERDDAEPAEAAELVEPDVAPSDGAAAGPEAEAAGGAAAEEMDGAALEPLAPATERTTDAGGGVAAAPDRSQELRRGLDDTQARWDDGADQAGDHQVHTCPEHATMPGTHPFARGPPLTVPPTTPGEAPEPAEPADVPREALTRAGTAVTREIARAPARAPPTNTAGLDDEERAELRANAADLDRKVDQSVARDVPATLEDETLVLDGDADPTRIDQVGQAATRTITLLQATAHVGAAEDFGDAVMAPVADPTQGLDADLDALTVPTLDVDDMVDTARLDLVATDANAGAVPIGDVVIVTSEQMAVTQQHAEFERTARAAISTDIAASDRETERHCTRATAKKAQAVDKVRTGVADRRGEWTDALDRRVADRNAETDDLVRTRRGHVERVQRETNSEASGVVTAARRDADSQWQDTRARARNKADEANDTSWWSQGIDWLRDALADLVSWIDDFIDACRQAIDALLDAAKGVAHGIIEAGRRAVTATIDGLHAGVDFIADNLPGELGELAREHRDDIHSFLDERQAEVDGWAEELHQGVDETIEGLREDLHTALDDFQQDVHDAADAIDEILENGLMPWLRRMFPGLAALVDGGLLDPINRASDALGDWLDGALEATGIRSVQRAVAGIEAEQLCQPPTEEQQAESCAALESMLQSVLAAVDGMLASPTALRIQAFLTEQRDEAAAQQVDAASDFFSFIHAVARPVYEWWQQIEPTVQDILDELGDIATTVWQHVAAALGIDPNLSPLEALRAGLQALWQAVAEAVAPLVAGIKEAWDWVRNSSPLSPLLDFFASLPELWDSLSALAGQIASGAADWLATAAEVLATTILPAANRIAGALADAVLVVIAQVETWVNGIVGALDAIIGFQAANAFVEVLVGLVGALASPARTALVAFSTCAFRVWRWLANSLRDLGAFLRTLLDVAVGISMAFGTFPIGLVAFFAGNVWLHLLPECYKPPLINFFLDLAIRFVRFFPEPADFMLAIVYQGALNFLQGVRAAADTLKVGAVNLFASIFAGNAEIAAGFIVGLAEGVWESTGGTIIFLLQAVAWILSLPFKLASWAIGMINGTLPEDTGEAADEPGVMRRAGAAPDGEEAAEPGTDSETAETAEPETLTVPEEAEEAEEAEVSETGGGAGDNTVAAEGTEGTPTSDVSEREAAPPAEVVDDPAADQPTDDEEPADVVPDAERRPPAGPEGASGLGAALQRLVTEGLSREDVQQLFDGAKASLRGMVGRLARDAAGALLAALNAAGAGFAIGRMIGSIVGQIIVEVALAVLTGGASAGVTAAKAAITGARVTAKFASAIAKIKRALAPLLDLVRTLRGALGDIIRGIQKWFDDVLRWMKGLGKRITRPRRGRPPRGRGPSRRGGHRRRRRRKQKDKRKRDNDRRRLARVMAVLRPEIQRMVRDGVGGARLRLRLAYWRRRYRLTSLTLTTDGQIVARINPSARVRLGKVRPEELGRILRPVLAAAQRQYVTETRARAARERRASGRSGPLQDAERSAAGTPGGADVEAGGVLGRGERQAFLSPDDPLAGVAERERSLRTRTARRELRPTPFSRGSHRIGGHTARQNPYRNGPRDLATIQLDMPNVRVGGASIRTTNDRGLRAVFGGLSREVGVSDRALSTIIAAPRAQQRGMIDTLAATLPAHQRRRLQGGDVGELVEVLSLRDDLEAARNPEIGAANAVARQLGVSGDLTLEQQFGAESGFSPASRRGVASTNERKRARAMAQAEADIGRIFHRLERAMRRPEVFKAQTGWDAQPLLAAVRRLLAAHRNGTATKAARREVGRAATALVAELVNLLRLYD